MVTKIYLVRHGEAEGNVEEFFQGQIDTSLTEKGRKQLEFLADRFKNIKIDKIYSSPLKRAYNTAIAINKYHNLKIIKDDKLKEIDAGLFEEIPWKDLPEKYPQALEKWENTMYDFIAPNGEKMTDVYERMKTEVSKIAEENPNKTICICSHGCALRNFLSYVEFGTIKKIRNVGWSDNTAVSFIEYSDGRWKLIYKNDSSHLPEDMGTIKSLKHLERIRKNENDIG